MPTTGTTNFTVRLDRRVKADAEKLFNDLGMTLSGAFNIFLHQALLVQGLPFELSRLVTEVRLQEIQGADIPRRLVILADDLQDHHPGPPVVRLSPLQAIDIGMVDGRAHESIGLR